MNAKRFHALLAAAPPAPAETPTRRRMNRRKAPLTAFGEPLESRTLFASSAGATLATALGLGQIGGGTQSFPGEVGNGASAAYYAFTVGTTTDFTIAASDKGDAGLIIGTNDAGTANRVDSVYTTNLVSGSVTGSLHQVLPPGSYYFEIASGLDDPYSLTYTAAPAPAGPGSTPGAAFPLGFLQQSGADSYSDWVGDADPADYYTFSLNAPTDVTVTVNGAATYGLGQDLNHNGVDDVGEELASAYAGNPVHQLLSAGSYFIFVKNDVDDAYYTLNVVEGGATTPPVPHPVVGPAPTPTPTPTPTPVPTPTPTSTDHVPPQASVSGLANVPAGSTTPYAFNVTYTDDGALNPASVSAGDVVVYGPGGTSLPVTLEAVTTVSQGEDVVTCQVPAPSTPGQYEVVLVGGRLADAAGNTAGQQTLGTFVVGGATPSPTPTPTPTPTPVSGPTPTPTPTGTTSPGAGPQGSIAGGLPASVVGGSKGAILFQFSNQTTLLQRELLTVNLFASPTPLLDASAVPLGPAVRERPSLPPGASRRYRLAYTVPNTLPSGSYYVLAKLSTGAIAASAAPVQVTAPLVDLAPSFPPHRAFTVAAGGRDSVLLRVVNTGNVAARGLLQITLSAAPAAGGAPATLADFAQRVDLKAGAGKTFRIRFRLPVGTPAGAYRLTALADPSDTFHDPDPDNNTAEDTTPLTVG